MFGGGLTDILQQAQKMKEEFEKVKDSVSSKTVEVVVGGGMVKVTANGKQQIVSLWIDPNLMAKNDVVMVQDLVLSGVNQALKQAQSMMADELKSMMGGFGALSQFLGK